MKFLEKFYERNNKQAQFTLILVIVATTLVFDIINIFDDFQFYFPIFLQNAVLMAALGWAIYKHKLFVAITTAFLMLYVYGPADLFNLIISGQRVTAMYVVNLIIRTIIAFYLLFCILAEIFCNKNLFSFRKKINKFVLIFLVISAVHIYLFSSFMTLVLLAIPAILAVLMRSQKVAIMIMIYKFIPSLFILLWAINAQSILNWGAMEYFKVITGIILLVSNVGLLIYAFSKDIDSIEYHGDYWGN